MMKKIIFLLLISIASYGQAEFPEGIQLGGNGPTVSTSKLISQDANGYLNYINASGLPVSTATQSSLNLKANLSGATFTGAVSVPTPTLSTHSATKGYADGLIVGLLNDRGPYDASTNLFPTTGGSGTAGAIMKGDIWYLTAGGILSSKIVRTDDSVRALTNSPGQTGANWSLIASPTQYTTANDLNVIHTTGNESKSGVLTLSTGAILSAETASTIASFDASKNLKSLATATYPNLTELSYLKGVTSAIQTQLNAKQVTLTNPVTGTGTANLVAKFTGTSSLGNSTIFDNGSMVGVGTIVPAGKFQVKTGTDENLALLSGAGRVVISAFNDAVSANVGISLDASDFEWKTSGVTRSSLSSSGVLKINNLAGTGTRQVVADASGYLSATTTPPDSRPYKVCTGSITLGASSATMGIVDENTLGSSLTWSKTGTGTYTAVGTGLFPVANKVRMFFSNNQVNGAIEVKGVRTDANTITLTTIVGGSLVDNVVSGMSIEIRVYN